MDYFITLNEKSIDAIGEAVEKPITVIEGLKETLAETIQEKDAIIAQKDEIIADKDEEIEGLEEQLQNTWGLNSNTNPLQINMNIVNNSSNPVIVTRGSVMADSANGYLTSDIHCSYVAANATKYDANAFNIRPVFKQGATSKGAFGFRVYNTDGTQKTSGCSITTSGTVPTGVGVTMGGASVSIATNRFYEGGGSFTITLTVV